MVRRGPPIPCPRTANRSLCPRLSPLRVTPFYYVETPVAQVTDRRHPGGVASQGLNDHGVDLFRRVLREPLQRHHTAVANEVDKRVDQPRQHGRIAVVEQVTIGRRSDATGSTPTLPPSSTSTVAPPTRNLHHHDHRSATQLRSPANLNRRQKGIHVDVEEPPGGKLGLCGHLFRLPHASLCRDAS